MLERALNNEKPPNFGSNIVAGQLITLDSLSKTLEIISEMMPDGTN